jgi:hypothetical protein
MKLSWKDFANTLLVGAGFAAVWARLYDYTWWFVGSFKGAMATIGVLGLVMLLVNVSELYDTENWANFGESILWLGAAALVITGLFVASKALFISAAIVMGVIYLTSLARHAWHSYHDHPTMPYVTAH